MMAPGRSIPKVETLGLGLWWSWVWLSYFGDTLIQSGAERFNNWLIFLLSISATLVIIAIFFRTGRSIANNKVVLCVAASFSSLGTLICAFVPSPLSLCICSVIMGISAAPWFFNWFEYSVLLDPENIGVNIASVFVLGVLLYFMLIDRPFPLGGILIATLPLISLAFIALREALANTDYPLHQAAPPSFWSLCRTIIAYIASFGVFEGFLFVKSSVNLNYFIIGGIGLGALLGGLLTLLRPKNTTSAGVYQIPLPFFVTGLVLLNVDIAYRDVLASLSIMMGWAFFGILSWIAVGQLVHSNHLSRFHILIAALCWQIGALIGAVFCVVFASFLDNTAFGIPSLAAVVMLAVIASVGPFKGIDGRILTMIKANQSYSPPPPPAAKTSYHSQFKTYALSTDSLAVRKRYY
ncbi:MAG: hypothetical protein LBK67_08945 [Coriobacteriales bacterium]|jgi:hypothetical protein|nr:hypothetical protein [Coriobacteriales bacterium]